MLSKICFKEILNSFRLELGDLKTELRMLFFVLSFLEIFKSFPSLKSTNS